MRANLADLTLFCARLRDPRVNVAAREPETEDEVDGRSGREEDFGIVAELVLWVGL